MTDNPPPVPERLQALPRHWRARADMEDHYDPEQTDEGHACMIERIRTYRRCADELEAALAAGPSADDAERTVASIAAMLGWGNVPPRETLERQIAALKARAAGVPPTASKK